MRTISVLGAVSAQRDALVTALRDDADSTCSPHVITTETGGCLSLLLGLPDDDLTCHGAALEDQRLRGLLNEAGQPYHVIYGALADQLAQAKRLIQRFQSPRSDASADQSTEASTPATWRWACDTCSDAACEHKLLTDLLARRT